MVGMKHCKRWIGSLIFLWSCFFSSLALADPALLTQMTITPVPHQSHTYNLRLTFNQTVSHKAFTLENPDRLVIDFPNALFQAKKNLPVWDGTPIKDFRHGIQDGVNLRLVFDLQNAVKFNSTASTTQPAQVTFVLTGKGTDTAPKTIAASDENISPAISTPPKKVITKIDKNIILPTSTTSGHATSTIVKPAVATIDNAATNARIDALVTASVISAEAKMTAKPVSSDDDKKSPSVAEQISAIDKPAAPAAIEKPAPENFFPTVTPSKKQRPFVVVIDAGHGGKDPGTTGPDGVREKNVTIAIARDLQQLVKQQPGMKASMTRSGDYYVGLRQRLLLARKAHGDVFVAIHADAYQEPDASGASVFALSPHGASSESARWLAQRENYSELSGIDLNGIQDQDGQLRSILIDLSQAATISASLQLGNDMLKQLSDVTDLHHGYVEQAPFMVLKSPDIPSILVETGFLSNPKEETRLSSSAYQKKIAQALFEGIRQYYLQYAVRNRRIVRMQSIS